MTTILGIIADDFTGANDTGVHLAKKGLTTRVMLKQSPSNEKLEADHADDIDVWIIDTNSRSLAPDHASNVVLHEMNRLKTKGVNRFYKKIDSTLRGNIARELIAVQNVADTDLVFIAPAFPKMGRTVVEGSLYVNGIPVTETEFAKDPKTPVLHNFIPNLLGEYREKTAVLTRHHLYQSNVHEWVQEQLNNGIKWIVCDTEKEEDFHILSQLDEHEDYSITWAGSAGLINHLKLVNDKVDTNKEVKLEAKQVLVVSGSLSSTTSEQIQHLSNRPNTHMLEIDPMKLLTEPSYQTDIMKKSTLLDSFDCLVIYVASTQENRDGVSLVRTEQNWSPTETAKRLSEGLGHLAELALTNEVFDAIIMTGGDTAKDICNVLQIHDMELLLEAETGLPLGSIKWNNNKLFAITKAGGFGFPNSIANAVDFLKGERITHDSN
ncbi:four-carbon acid sugar kinase family protein [Jeotgalibacillus marinus]|uniref:Four-carbon acid sugar kinase family protein n=1 Tax=Jeotgalibacillus marinus TaxID=86667 RepID=A0ABV3Q1X8_9BACL